MEQTFPLSGSVFPFLNANELKLLAMAFMLTDHIGCFLVNRTAPAYWVCRSVGRLAFPIFCFLIAEGACRTRSIPKYMARLGLFGLVSTPPFNLVNGDPPFALRHLNVFFSLLLGLCAIALVREGAPRVFRLLGRKAAAENPLACAVLALPFCVVPYALAYLLNTDYGGFGVAAILLFYLLRRHPIAAWSLFALITLVSFNWYFYTADFTGAHVYLRLTPYHYLAERLWERDFTVRYYDVRQKYAILAAPLCLLYSGRQTRRKTDGRTGHSQTDQAVKYLFYAFYPVHLAVIRVIQVLR